MGSRLLSKQAGALLEVRNTTLRANKDGLRVNRALARRLSKQNILATLRLRIKTLEEKNRELTELLERAYGQIAQT